MVLPTYATACLAELHKSSPPREDQVDKIRHQAIQSLSNHLRLTNPVWSTVIKPIHPNLVLLERRVVVGYVPRQLSPDATACCASPWKVGIIRKNVPIRRVRVAIRDSLRYFEGHVQVVETKMLIKET